MVFRIDSILMKFVGDFDRSATLGRQVFSIEIVHTFRRYTQFVNASTFTFLAHNWHIIVTRRLDAKKYSSTTIVEAV